MSHEEQDWLESLERGVQELEALQAIYQDDDDDDDSATIKITLKSSNESQAAQTQIEQGKALLPAKIPTLELEL